MKIEAEIREGAAKERQGTGERALHQFAHFMRSHLDCGAVIIQIAEGFSPLFASSGDRPHSAVCAYARELMTAGGDRTVVQDPARLVDPLVAIDLGFGFYAGLPLRLSSGEPAGMLAAIDASPRALAENELANLKMLASIVVQMIEFRIATARADPGSPSADRSQAVGHGGSERHRAAGAQGRRQSEAPHT